MRSARRECTVPAVLDDGQLGSECCNQVITPKSPSLAPVLDSTLYCADRGHTNRIQSGVTLTAFIDPWRFGFYPAGREHLATLLLQVDIEDKSGVLRRLPDTCLGRSGRLLWPHAAECRGLCVEQHH